MRPFLKVFSILMLIVGVLMTVSMLISVGSPSSPLFLAGAAFGRIILAVAGFVGLLLLRFTSPRRREQVAARHQIAQLMHDDELENLVEQELCQRFQISRDQVAAHLTRELRIPIGEIHVAFDDLHSDYNLEISSDDSSSIQSVRDVCRLIIARRQSSH